MRVFSCIFFFRKIKLFTSILSVQDNQWKLMEVHILSYQFSLLPLCGFQIQYNSLSISDLFRSRPIVKVLYLHDPPLFVCLFNKWKWIVHSFIVQLSTECSFSMCNYIIQACTMTWRRRNYQNARQNNLSLGEYSEKGKKREFRKKNPQNNCLNVLLLSWKKRELEVYFILSQCIPL